MRRGAALSTVCAAVAVLLLAGCSAAPKPRLLPGAVWFDDWYTVSRIDEHTFAIAEPRYEQQNVNYLIVGNERAVLYDTGPGERDIRPVVASLTTLPVTATFSHLHYDHIGDQASFAHIAALDHPTIRAGVGADGGFTPAVLQFGGFGRPTFRIDEWWPADSTIDLGGRSLQVLSVPGHTPESMALWDAENEHLFTGDFFYRGDLFAFVPGSSVADYRASTNRLLELTADHPEVAIFGAHVQTSNLSPQLSRRDLANLGADLETLESNRAPTWTLTSFAGIPVRRYRFADGIVLLAPLF